MVVKRQRKYVFTNDALVAEKKSDVFPVNGIPYAVKTWLVPLIRVNADLSNAILNITEN